MSTKLNGRRYSKPGTRVPYNLLPEAIAWEDCRAQILTRMGRYEEAQQATSLMRFFQERAINEAEQ